MQFFGIGETSCPSVLVYVILNLEQYKKKTEARSVGLNGVDALIV